MSIEFRKHSERLYFIFRLFLGVVLFFFMFYEIKENMRYIYIVNISSSIKIK